MYLNFKKERTAVSAESTNMSKETTLNDLKAHLDAAEKICRENKIPFFFAVTESSLPDKTEYDYRFSDGTIFGAEIADNKIPGFINVANGFSTVPKNDIMELEV